MSKQKPEYDLAVHGAIQYAKRVLQLLGLNTKGPDAVQGIKHAVAFSLANLTGGDAASMVAQAEEAVPPDVVGDERERRVFFALSKQARVN